MTRGAEHPTDTALQEWSRFGETRIAGEATEAVAAHLEACGACRAVVEDFRRLDGLMHPFGEAPPVDPRPARFRRLVRLLALGVGIAALVWGLVWLGGRDPA